MPAQMCVCVCVQCVCVCVRARVRVRVHVCGMCGMHERCAWPQSPYQLESVGAPRSSASPRAGTSDTACCLGCTADVGRRLHRSRRSVCANTYIHAAHVFHEQTLRWHGRPSVPGACGRGRSKPQCAAGSAGVRRQCMQRLGWRICRLVEPAHVCDFIRN